MDFIKAIVLVVGMIVLFGTAVYLADHEMFVKTLTEVKGMVDSGVDSFTKK